MKNSEVVHKFAYRQSGKGSNLYSDGSKLWSYNTVIAEWVGDVLVISNTRYSNTTYKHQYHLRRATSHVQTVAVHGFWSQRSFVEHSTCSYYREEIEKAKQAYITARPHVKGKYARIYANLLNAVRAITMHVPSWPSLSSLVPEYHVIGALFAEADLYDATLRVRREKREEKAQQPKIWDWEDKLQAWRDGKRQSLTHKGTLDYLRIRTKLGVVETSQGVKVPITEAIAFYPLLKNCLQSGCIGLRLQHYQVREVNKDYVRIGCHTISWDEIESIYNTLQ